MNSENVRIEDVRIAVGQKIVYSLGAYVRKDDPDAQSSH